MKSFKRKRVDQTLLLGRLMDPVRSKAPKLIFIVKLTLTAAPIDVYSNNLSFDICMKLRHVHATLSVSDHFFYCYVSCKIIWDSPLVFISSNLNRAENNVILYNESKRVHLELHWTH